MIKGDTFLSLINDDQERGQLFKNYQFIEYLEERLFRKYEPTKAPGLQFFHRMDEWLKNVESTEHQIVLYNLISKIFFVGEEEFNALYRVAFNEVIIPWIIEGANLKFNAPDFEIIITKNISETWFCPITDSLRISAFYHVNNIQGKEYRPDWRSLRMFADKERIKKYILDSGIKRLVLLEDFVGSGGQVSETLAFVESLELGIDVIVVPLVICPKGDEKISGMLKGNITMTYKPVLRIPSSEIFTVDESVNENICITEVRAINSEYSNSMGLDFNVNDAEKIKIGTFGYKNTGALIVMYSNCPNNTLALIHRSNDDNWKPLFPRSERFKV